MLRDEDVEKVANVILESAHTVFAGDGIISVHPVDYIIKIKTRGEIER